MSEDGGIARVMMRKYGEIHEKARYHRRRTEIPNVQLMIFDAEGEKETEDSPVVQKDIQED
jgi:hypothetical protein